MRSKRLRLIVRYLRACARHLAYNPRCVGDALRCGEIRPTFPFSKEPDPEEERGTHPSYLCRCACGREAPRAEHDAGCLWAADMCPTCEGNGHFPGSLGNGSAPDHQPDHQQGRTCA